jgi:hypothetical protein
MQANQTKSEPHPPTCEYKVIHEWNDPDDHNTLVRCDGAQFTVNAYKLGLGKIDLVVGALLRCRALMTSFQVCERDTTAPAPPLPASPANN